MSSPHDEHDAVVIGAGPGGLSAALALARGGMRVLLAEKNERVGGNCTSRRYGAYTFDLAVHQLTGMEHGWAGAVLEEYGVRERIDLHRVDPFLVVEMPDASYRMPSSWEALFEEMREAFPGNEPGLRRFFRSTHDLIDDGLISHRILFGDNPVMRSLLARVPLRKLLTYPATLPRLLLSLDVTGETIFRRHLRDPRLLSVLAASWPYLGLPPSKMSGVMLSYLVAGQHKDGTFYPVGSSQRVADVLAEALRERGGTIATSSPVRRIDVAGGRVCGVELEGGRRVRAPIVVANAPALHVYADLIDPKARPRELVERLQRTPRSLGPFKVYLGLDIDVSQHGLPCHEYLFYDDYDHDRTFAELERGYVSMVSAYSPVRADPSLAPPGHSTLILTSMFPWRPSERDWREHSGAIADEMIAKVERKVPGLREHIVERRILTPEDLRRFSNATDGAMYGWANVPESSLLKRLHPVSPIRGLFHAGHWTQPGTGVTTAISCGYQVALDILRRERGWAPARLFRDRSKPRGAAPATLSQS